MSVLLLGLISLNKETKLSVHELASSSDTTQELFIFLPETKQFINHKNYEKIIPHKLILVKF